MSPADQEETPVTSAETLAAQEPRAETSVGGTPEPSPRPAATSAGGTPESSPRAAEDIPRGRWWRGFGSEIRMIFGRRRNQLLLLGLALIPLVIGVAVKLFSDSHGGGGMDLVSRIAGSGLFLAAVSFVVSMPVFLPLVISVVAGDALAGDAQLGTVRYALIMPVSRSKWLAMKAVGILVFTAVGVVIVLAVALATGFGLFGVHPMTLLSGDTISVGAGVVRILWMAAYVVASLTGLLAVGLFISSLTEVPIAAMAGTAIVPAVCTVLLAVPQLAPIQPGLITAHWLDITTFLFAQPDLALLRAGLLLQLAWVAVFGALAWARVASQDVTA